MERSSADACRRPMDGFRVLDFTANVAGPLAGQVLADLGAEVVKIEPEVGEAGRRIASTIPGQEELRPYFLPHHRGKKSVIVDLRSQRGLDQVLGLVDSADVLIESFRPGVMVRLGLGADAVQARNPQCVYASLSAFGGKGFQHERPGIDALIQAESGMLTGLQSGNEHPRLTASTIVDASSGHVLAQAVLAALLGRERYGFADTVDVALYDVAVSLQAPLISRQLNTASADAHLTEAGRSTVAVAPSGSFRAADGYLMLFAYVPKHWALLTSVLGRPDLDADPRFVDQHQRTVNGGALKEILDAIFLQRPVADWVVMLQAKGIMATAMKTWQQVVESDAFAESGLAITVGSGSRVETAVRMPARYGSFGPAALSPTPLLGEHTDEILNGVGNARGW